MKLHLRTTLLAALVGTVASASAAHAGRRPDLNAMKPADRQRLADALFTYVTRDVLDSHTGITHTGEELLTGHRGFLHGFEHFLIHRGMRQFVPLPSWNPANPIPAEFHRVKNELAPGFPTTIANANPNMPLEARFRFPAVCSFTSVAALGNAINGWHGSVHVRVGGAMRDASVSPAALIFWPWHAYIDDVYYNYERCSERPDLVAFKLSGTGTNKTEVHSFSGESSFFTQSSAVSPLPTTDRVNWEYEFVDWNRDGHRDLVAIRKNGTGTRTTEVHVYDGRSSFSTPMLQTGTALHETGRDAEFEIADWNFDGVYDLVYIAKANTGSGQTEIHVLSGADNFRTFLLHSATVLHPVDEHTEFEIVDWNRDTYPDMAFVIKKLGTRGTELHVLDGSTHFRSYLLNTTTFFGQTPGWEFEILDWNMDDVPDLAAISSIMSSDSGSSTGVTILSGTTLNSNVALVRSFTGLHPTDHTFTFALADYGFVRSGGVTSHGH